MKTTTKFFASAVAAMALFFTTNVNAQKNLGFGLNLGVPTSDKYEFAVGGDVRLQFNLNEQLSVPLTAGYTHITTGGGASTPNDFGYVPLKAGLKYFLNTTGSGAYALGEVGAAIGVSKDAGTSLLFSPAIGYSWSNGLDLSLKYEGMPRTLKNTDHVALRIAYGFEL